MPSEPLQPGIYNTQNVIDGLGVSRDLKATWYRHLRTIVAQRRPEFNIAPVGNHFVGDLNDLIATLRESQLDADDEKS